MNDYINEKILPKVMKFTNSKIITALKNGMIYTIPFIIIGSVFLILSSLPVTSWAAWMTSTGLVHYFNLDYSPRYWGHEIASGRSESNVWSVANTD